MVTVQTEKYGVFDCKPLQVSCMQATRILLCADTAALLSARVPLQQHLYMQTSIAAADTCACVVICITA
jgi:hypothetical protein